MSGVALAALFPKLGAWPLVWLALVPLLLAVRGARPRRAAGLGLLTGVLFFGILLEWIRLFDTVGWVLLTLVQGAYLALFAFLLRRLRPAAGGWPALLLPAVAWTALEWLRAQTRAGFTWGDLAYALHGSVALMQLASLVGPLGLTFLIVLTNAAVAACLEALREERGSTRAAAGRLAVVLGVLALCWGWGRWRLAQPIAGGEPLRIAVVQGNEEGAGREVAWNPASTGETARAYLHLTAEAARDRPDVIVWPETAVPDYLLQNPEVVAEIAQTARRLQVNLIVGGSHQEVERESGRPVLRRLNSAFLFTREGILAGRYDKVHLVPYGEFTPWRQPLAFLYRHFPIRDVDYASGRGFFPLQADAAPLGTVICFESAFPYVSRAQRRAGAQVLAILTNDAWFGTRGATWQHYQMAAFRAVESGSYVVRAATTGFSAIIDPRGRVLAQTPLFQRGVLAAEVRRMPQPTLYQRLGDVVGWGCALATILMLLLQAQGARAKR